MTVFQKVQDLLANEAALVEFANSDGEPISAGDISVSLKAAALIAAHGAAFLHVQSQYGVVTPERYLNTLRTIADDKMSGPLLRSACYVAHLTWMTSQPFRGADRIARLSQFTFSNLPPNEQVKDREHVVKAARFIVDKLGAELAAAA